MKCVFITGAAGFIGSRAAREFAANGWHLLALVRNKVGDVLPKLAESGAATLIRGDAFDYQGMKDSLAQELARLDAKLDLIVHCAGRSADVGRAADFKRNNYDAVKNIVRLTQDIDAGRLLFVSTTDVYGLKDFHGEGEDELPLENNTGNSYPGFKILSEKWLRESLPSCKHSIIRPGAVWGDGDTTLTPRLVDFLKTSPCIIHFGKWKGRNRWPLAHVKNLAVAIYLASVSPETAGQAVNVLDNEFTSVDDFYRLLAKIYLPGKNPGTLCLPHWAGIPLAAPVSAISNLLNLYRPFIDPSLYALRSVSSNLDFSNERMRNLFKNAGREILSRDKGLGELS